MNDKNKAFDIILGDTLFRARVVQRMTQDEITTLISRDLKQRNIRNNGISRGAYAFYERGERSMPIDIFQSACNILKLDWRDEFNKALDVYDK